MSKRKKIKVEEKIRIAKECIAGRISQSEAEAQTGVSRTVVADWIRLYQNEGVNAFLPKRGNLQYDPILILQQAEEGEDETKYVQSS